MTNHQQDIFLERYSQKLISDLIVNGASAEEIFKLYKEVDLPYSGNQVSSHEKIIKLVKNSKH